jgi:hypothetical protein
VSPIGFVYIICVHHCVTRDMSPIDTELTWPLDQSLVDSIEQTSPYNKNTIARTSNAADQFTGYGATPNYDPFPEYIQLGSDLSHGLFMWLEMAVNLTFNYDSYAPPAAWQDGTQSVTPSPFPVMTIALLTRWSTAGEQQAAPLPMERSRMSSLSHRLRMARMRKK